MKSGGNKDISITQLAENSSQSLGEFEGELFRLGMKSGPLEGEGKD